MLVDMNSSARDGLLAGLLLAQALGQVSPVGLGTALRQRLDQGLHGAREGRSLLPAAAPTVAASRGAPGHWGQGVTSVETRH